MLPYDALIAPIAYFFHHNKNNQPNPEQTKLISKWFWHASLSNRFSSAVETKLRDDVLLMKEILQHKIPRLNYTEKITSSRVKEERYTSSSAFSLAVLVLLNKKQPLYFENNTPIQVTATVSKLSRAELHHIFPKKYLVKQKEIGKIAEEVLEYADSIANICFVPKLRNIKIGDNSPKIYLEELKKINSKLNEALNSHLIDNITENTLNQDNFIQFLEYRASLIANALNEYL